jgi:hypothetical protein
MATSRFGLISNNYSYKCPKCGGSDYYMSNRNVMRGIGGIWGNRGGVKKFPVCKACEEIMDRSGSWKFTKKGLIIVLAPIFIYFLFWIVAYLGAYIICNTVDSVSWCDSFVD